MGLSTATGGAATGGAATDLMVGAVQRMLPGLRDDGELVDPIFGEPTQYGTAYFGYVNAALAVLGRGGPGEHAGAARRCLAATLRHLLDPSARPAAAGFSFDVGSAGYANHRDFMWPAVMRTLRLLQRAGEDVSALSEQVRAVAAPEVFARMPPHNWASVWMVGEQARMAAGMSPHASEAMDAWVGAFFSASADEPEPRADVTAGFYREPGLPNSYDLFTRLHLFDLLEEGYTGPHRDMLERLVRTGLRRSLGVQLSSGSLASAHRSTGQLWTLTAQVCFFHRAARRLAGEDGALAARAEQAAARAFAAIEAAVRPDGGLSPVENALPAGYRVGYESYTADAHYVSLALGFLSTAVLEGFSPAPVLPGAQVAGAFVEPAPLHRALVHADGWSLHVDLAPQPGYDAFGVADLTLGPGRRLAFGAQVHHGRAGTLRGYGLWGGAPLTLGLGLWDADGALTPLSGLSPEGGVRLGCSGRQLEAQAELGARRYPYHMRAELAGDRARFDEGAGDGRYSLLVPYLRDRGDGTSTELSWDGGALELRHGRERVAVVCSRPVERFVHLPYGFESRHGLVGLARLDLAGRGEVGYEVRRAA